MKRGAFFSMALAAMFAVPAAIAQDTGQPDANQPPPHTQPFPNLGSGETRDEVIASLKLAPQLRRAMDARDLLDQRQRLADALEGLAPQRPGVVDAYVVSVALDSDPVFAREAREAGRVLASRYDANGRTLTLAGPDGMRDDRPRGSIDALLVALAHIAEVMDTSEDVLVLYSTSHGIKLGVTYHYGDTGYGILTPARLKQVFADLGIERRILIISACFSGIFVPELASDHTAILTAAAAQRTSFGCAPENDWTFFGDALVNRALRQPQGLEDAAREASRTIAEWETTRRLLASLPQNAFGAKVSTWLPALEARGPRVASAPVGRPAVGE